jgi:hypothetical protein
MPLALVFPDATGTPVDEISVQSRAFWSARTSVARLGPPGR